LNEICRLASVAEYSFTGMETRPNETVSEAIDRAAMIFSLTYQGLADAL
jgi:hypothetical protein